MDLPLPAGSFVEPDGEALTYSAQVQIGGNETYVPLCRRHWRAAMGDDGG